MLTFGSQLKSFIKKEDFFVSKTKNPLLLLIFVIKGQKSLFLVKLFYREHRRTIKKVYGNLQLANATEMLNTYRLVSDINNWANSA